MKKLMAIVNCTPDSYYDGGWGQEVERAKQMCAEGADILDIGGESTRPGHTPVSIDEELSRVMPVVRALQGYTLSIDTSKYEVAKAALEEGVSMLNDVTGFVDPRMRRLAAEWKVPIVVMHDGWTNLEQMCSDLAVRVQLLLNDGVERSQIILDPGIGWKTVDNTLHILKNIRQLCERGYPVLIGLSRKSFMQKILNRGATEVLPSTLALNTMAMLEGVDYIRVHDVREHREIITVMERISEKT